MKVKEKFAEEYVKHKYSICGEVQMGGPGVKDYLAGFEKARELVAKELKQGFTGDAPGTSEKAIMNIGEEEVE